MTKIISFLLLASVLSGCASIDTERATEQRKAELCKEIDTQVLSHCPGNHIPPPSLN